MDSFYKKVLKTLNSYQVEYLIVGGFAVNFHGYNRSTADLDIWMKIEATNLTKLSAALSHLDFILDEEGISRLQDEEIVSFSEGDHRVELMPRMNISGIVTFSEAADRSDVRNIDGIEYHIISLHDLIMEKSKSKRYKDLDDLSKLEEAAARYESKSKEK